MTNLIEKVDMEKLGPILNEISKLINVPNIVLVAFPSVNDINKSIEEKKALDIIHLSNSQDSSLISAILRVQADYLDAHSDCAGCKEKNPFTAKLATSKSNPVLFDTRGGNS